MDSDNKGELHIVNDSDNSHHSSLNQAATQTRDDTNNSVADTLSRRKYDMNLNGFNGAPIAHCSSDGVVTIEMDSMNENSGFYIKWNSLSYKVKSSWYQNPWKRTSKTILNNLNGFFLSGELIALMGPSGKLKSKVVRGYLNERLFTKQLTINIHVFTFSRLLFRCWQNNFA